MTSACCEVFMQLLTAVIICKIHWHVCIDIVRASAKDRSGDQSHCLCSSVIFVLIYSLVLVLVFQLFSSFSFGLVFSIFSF